MKAIILSESQGEGLRPIANSRPISMVEVAGRPILEYQLYWLREQGIRRVVVSCGHLYRVVQDYFGNGDALGLAVEYACGGGVKPALALLGATSASGPVLVVDGGTITNLDLAPVMRRHREMDALATVVLVRYRSPYGIVELDPESRIRRFHQKPLLPYWVSSGIYLLERSAYSLLPDIGEVERETFSRLAERGQLAAFKYWGYWRPIDSLKDVAEATEEVLSGLWVPRPVEVENLQETERTA